MLLSGTVALVVSSAATLAQPYYFGKIIGVCSDPNADNASLNKYALLLLCIFLVGGVATFIRGYQVSFVNVLTCFEVASLLFDDYLLIIFEIITLVTSKKTVITVYPRGRKNSSQYP